MIKFCNIMFCIDYIAWSYILISYTTYLYKLWIGRNHNAAQRGINAIGNGRFVDKLQDNWESEKPTAVFYGKLINCNKTKKENTFKWKCCNRVKWLWLTTVLICLINYYLVSSIFFIILYQKVQILQIFVLDLDILTNHYLESSLSVKIFRFIPL